MPALIGHGLRAALSHGLRNCALGEAIAAAAPEHALRARLLEITSDAEFERRLLQPHVDMLQG